MREKLAKLIDVKSIVTLLVFIVFCVQTIRGNVNSEQFITILTVLTGFYFGTQSNKDTTTK